MMSLSGEHNSRKERYLLYQQNNPVKLDYHKKSKPKSKKSSSSAKYFLIPNTKADLEEDKDKVHEL